MGTMSNWAMIERDAHQNELLFLRFVSDYFSIYAYAGFAFLGKVDFVWSNCKLNA